MDWNYGDAIKYLKRQGIGVDETTKRIVPNKEMRGENYTFVGIGQKTWGCIDYLKGQRFTIVV